MFYGNRFSGTTGLALFSIMTTCTAWVFLEHVTADEETHSLLWNPLSIFSAFFPDFMSQQEFTYWREA